MPVLAVTATYSSYYYKDDPVYATAHDAASAEVMGSALDIGQTLEGGIHAINRAGLYFNTSSIPSDAALISAVLSLYGLSDNSVTDFSIRVVNGSALSNPRVAANYSDLLAATTSGGSISTVALSLTSYNDITLNATGLGFITKAGTTKLALKSQDDVSSVAATGSAYVSLYGLDATYPAKLAVYYMKKGNLFVKAENLHYVSDTGVERYIPGIAV